MKRYNSMQIFTAMLAAAVMLVAGCTKNDLVETNRPLPPAGMGELTLGKLRLSGDVVSDPATGAAASDPTSRATAAGTSTDPATGAPGAPATDPAGATGAQATGATGATGAAATAATATPAALSPDAGSRAATTLPAGSTLRLYAFAVGETDFGSKLASRTYTIDAAGAAHLDAGQQPLFLPVGTADIYLVGPVEHNTGTQDAPVMVEVASEWGITPRAGADLIAAYAQATVVAGNSNPLPSMELTHKMARVQVVVSEHAQAAYENLNVLEVKLYAQPQTGSYTLDTSGGTVTADETNTADVAFATIAQEQAAKRFSITTVVLPQAERELKIETTFECNQKNLDVGDNHPKLKYRQSGLIVSALAAGSATQFTTAPLTPVEIKWRTKVLPWNDVEGGDFVIPGLDLEVPFVEIDGVKWTTGNLVAYGQNDCRVGRPSDGGLFFQFGSLIGWSGGTSGDGTGQSQGPSPSIPSLYQHVWPVEMGATKPTFGWQNSNGSGISTLKNFYFNYSSGVWGTDNPNSDIGTFAEPISGDTGSGNLRGGRYATLGVGDPCTYYLGEPWRTPTQTELLALKNSGYSSWTTVGGMPGRWFGPNAGDAQTSIFLSAAAHRYYSTANIWHPGTEARYGTSSVKNATQHYYMYVNNSKAISPDQHNRSSAVPARCVSGKYLPPPQHKPEEPAADQIVEIDGLQWTTGNLVARDAVNCKVGAPEDGGLYFQLGSLIGWKGGATGDGTGRPTKADGSYYSGASFNAANEVAVVPATFNKIGDIGTTWPNQTINLYYFGLSTYLSADLHLNNVFSSGSLSSSGVGDPCHYYLGDTWRMPTAEEIKVMDNAATKSRTGTWAAGTSTDSYFVWTFSGSKEVKFPAVGLRNNTNGTLQNVGNNGFLWSSWTNHIGNGYNLYFNQNSVNSQNDSYRRHAIPVRCVSGTYLPPAPPHNPQEPAADQIVEIAGLQWTTGNLVARDASNCKVGAPEDGGLYFQFGSLLGWKGGATGDGTGRAAKATNSYYNSASFITPAKELSVVPANFSKINDISYGQWPNNAGTNRYYFGYNTSPYATKGTNIQDYPGVLDGSLAKDGVGDPCRYYLGGTWRMPTTDDFEKTQTAANESWLGTWVSGTSTNSYTVWSFADGNELKFPAVGYRDGGYLVSVGRSASYWTSLIERNIYGHYMSFFNNNSSWLSQGARRNALPVRCVRPK